VFPLAPRWKDVSHDPDAAGRPAPPDNDAPLDPAIARLALRLDDAISAFRAGEASGIFVLTLVRSSRESGRAVAPTAPTGIAHAFCVYRLRMGGSRAR
jgi:hypothetical protein